MDNVVLSCSLDFFFCIVIPSTLKYISKLDIIISLFDTFVNITKPSIVSSVNNLTKELFIWNKFSIPI